MTPFDRLSASLPENHDGPIGIIDSADLRAVLADARNWDTFRTAWQALAGTTKTLAPPASTTEED